MLYRLSNKLRDKNDLSLYMMPQPLEIYLPMLSIWELKLNMSSRICSRYCRESLKIDVKFIFLFENNIKNVFNVLGNNLLKQS